MDRLQRYLHQLCLLLRVILMSRVTLRWPRKAFQQLMIFYLLPQWKMYPNTESTATLGTATGIGATHATGRDVWQGANFGTPTSYTVNNQVIYFDIPFEDDIAGENIFMDYYQTLTAVNSDADLLDEPEYDFYVNYLKFKIKYLKKNGEIDVTADPDYQMFLAGVERLVVKETTGQYVFFVPDTDGMLTLNG